MATRSKAVLIEYARGAAEELGIDPDEVVRALEQATRFDPDLLIAATEGNADGLYEAIDWLVGRIQAGEAIRPPAEETPTGARLGGHPVTGDEDLGPPGGTSGLPAEPVGTLGMTAGPEGRPTPTSTPKAAPEVAAPREATPTRPLTSAERAEQTRRDVAAQRDVDEEQPGALKPQVRGLRDIIGQTTPGQMPQYGRFTGTELGQYLPLGEDDPLAARNLMRLMGYEPNQGNPSVGFLQSLVPQLGRQSDIQRRLEGGYALDTYPEDLSEEEKDLMGQEARMRLLGDVSGTLGRGATSMVTPGQGLKLLEQLNAKVSTPGEEEDLTGLQGQFGGDSADAAQAAWDVVKVLVGGAMSPYMMSNKRIRDRTLNRMWEDYQNRGTDRGGSFLNYLVQKLKGMGGSTKPLAATVGAE